MPMTTTHALIPLAGVLAFTNRPVPWRLVIGAVIAAALPDLDGLPRHLWTLPASSIYAHRGAAHSLFFALAMGLLAAAFHRQLKVPPLAAGVVIAAAMASHGILDMMTDSGQPVACLWPLKSVRLFADWRPIHGGPVQLAHLISQTSDRLRSELWQIIVPMFALAFAIRGARAILGGG
jgi:inner membrane protein